MIPARVVSVLVRFIFVACFGTACEEDWKGAYKEEEDVRDRMGG